MELQVLSPAARPTENVVDNKSSATLLYRDAVSPVDKSFTGQGRSLGEIKDNFSASITTSQNASGNVLETTVDQHGVRVNVRPGIHQQHRVLENS